MNVEKTGIKDCFILKPQVFKDNRGYFMESYNEKIFYEKTGVNPHFVQDNQSHSSYGVIRGLHAQSGTAAQAKLVRVLAGEVLDVVVDLRNNSPTYLKKVAVKLTAENQHQLFVPRGCLHGFSVLSKEATFFYKCDNFYDQASEYGYRYDDSFFDIDWKVPLKDQVISSKDLELPVWKK